ATPSRTTPVLASTSSSAARRSPNLRNALTRPSKRARRGVVGERRSEESGEHGIFSLGCGEPNPARRAPAEPGTKVPGEFFDAYRSRAAAQRSGSRRDGSRDCRDFRKARSEEHTSELQSRLHLVCRL